MNTSNTISPFDAFSSNEHQEYCKWLETAHAKVADPTPDNTICNTFQQISITPEITEIQKQNGCLV